MFRHRSCSVVLYVLAFMVQHSIAPAEEKPMMRITNHQAGSTVRYPVVLLCGEIDDLTAPAAQSRPRKPNAA